MAEERIKREQPGRPEQPARPDTAGGEAPLTPEQLESIVGGAVAQEGRKKSG
jgi:hypothetical protein